MLVTSGCSGSKTPKQWNSPPEMQIDPEKTYYADIITNLGSFKINLFTAEAPVTVNNFVFLAREDFYEDIVFHRVMKDFMIQTGDPTESGGGGPGYLFADELPVKHTYAPGIVAMANKGPNSNGSQFFICTGYQAQGLNNLPNYTQFGQIVEGMDVVLKIASVEVTATTYGELSKPINPPFIKKINISES
jgi:cyclophilin family peptidyl-prolyl cis-trans isomerase